MALYGIQVQPKNRQRQSLLDQGRVRKGRWSRTRTLVPDTGRGGVQLAAYPFLQDLAPKTWSNVSQQPKFLNRLQPGLAHPTAFERRQERIDFGVD